MDDKRQEVIAYIRDTLTVMRYYLPASFLDDLERVLNKWDEELLS